MGKKIIKIAEELSIPIVAHCSEKTKEAIENLVNELNLRAPFTFHIFNNWEDFLIISKNVQPADIIMLVTGREDSVVYQPILEKIPRKMEIYFQENTKIMVYL